MSNMKKIVPTYDTKIALAVANNVFRKFGYVRTTEAVHGERKSNKDRVMEALATTPKYTKADLKKAYVQVKLSIIKNAQLVDTIVKNIAEAANTQNKVHPADFFANPPFHTKMEKFSRKIVIPVEE